MTLNVREGHTPTHHPPRIKLVHPTYARRRTWPESASNSDARVEGSDAEMGQKAFFFFLNS